MKNLPPSDVTHAGGLPVTTVAKSVMDVIETTGRLGLASQAIKDARKEGYISATELASGRRRCQRELTAGIEFLIGGGTIAAV